MAEILVVDDSRVARLWARKALESDEHTVYEAESVDDAWGRLAAWQPSLVVLDWNMPGGNGLDLVYWMRARPELVGVPVLFATSEADPRRFGYAQEAGAQGYIVKPYTVEQLLAAVRALLAPSTPPRQSEH